MQVMFLGMHIIFGAISKHMHHVYIFESCVVTMKQNILFRLVGGGGLADVSISRVQNQNDDQCGDTTDSSVAYLNATDLLYFKNVLLKFVVAQSSGRTRECEILLPAIATLLKADKKEFEVLKDSISLHHNRTNVLDLGAWFS